MGITYTWVDRTETDKKAKNLNLKYVKFALSCGIFTTTDAWIINYGIPLHLDKCLGELGDGRPDLFS